MTPAWLGRFKHKRVLVTGGRGYTDQEVIWGALADLEPSEIIEGGARGTDGYARGFSVNVMGKKPTTFPADWDTYGKQAGRLRNTKMLAESKPDFVLAFPGGNGTADMVSKAKAAGVTVIRVGADGAMEEENGN
jgi:hypothetical protein